MMQIISEHQQAIRNDERKILNDLRIVLIQFGALPEDAETLGNSIEQLDELFLLVVAGEFNSGKSAFINALLGQRLLQEGVTPTTTQIQVLRHGTAQNRIVINEHHHILNLPADLLREISIVDTPGTNAIIREHEVITAQFIPRADLVLFVTSADRPFTESERQFLTQIRDWGKKVVLIVNKIDILQTQGDRDEVQRFVLEHGRALLLGVTPDVFLVSARKALQSKLGQPQLWAESGFEVMENYIRDRLDESGRLRLKLLSPLGTGVSLVKRYLQIISDRLGLLREDFKMLDDVDAQLKLYDEDLKRDFRFRLSDVENALFELEQRGDDFFEETFRLARIFDLISKERIEREFEQQVVGDIPQRIEQKVNEVIDWLLDAELRQWQGVIQHISERRSQHRERIVGDMGAGSFNYDRDRLMDAVGRDARRVVDTFDKQQESALIAEEAQVAVATSLAVSVGAVGLGALVTAMATTAAMDVTGILSAGVIAALGLFIIPMRRRKARQVLHEKIADMRARLLSSLTGAFEKESARSQQQIREAISPYSRFVRAESEKLQNTQERLETISAELSRLKGLIEEI